MWLAAASPPVWRAAAWALRHPTSRTAAGVAAGVAVGSRLSLAPVTTSASVFFFKPRAPLGRQLPQLHD